MKPGFFFYVVGPSGAGKDSLIDGARQQLPKDKFVFARRTITRPPGKPGEDYESRTDDEFEVQRQRGDFLITWDAHGLRYGLQSSLIDQQASGLHIIANGSRAMVEILKARVSNLVIIEITAPIELLAKRIAQRGRETEQEIRARLARQVNPLPADVRAFHIQNDQSLAIGISRFVATLLHVTGLSKPAEQAQHKKISGYSLKHSEIADLFKRINSGEVAQEAVDAVLIEYCQQLDDEELIAMAKVRSEFMPRIEWPSSIVVDKHSLGGTPGSRVTMVVIPIVAEHGLLIPKTSSRAITSAAGTADAMEVLARVDLTRDQVREVTLATRGCIAWNGRLNHSRLDEAMNAITRPLALDTRRWSVASILSKKYSAGATHIVIDIPYSPTGKVKSAIEADGLGQLFTRVGAALGLTVRAFGTPGQAPIGRGLGPALEARDVLMTLSGDADAPHDLREKALFFAGQILAFDPDIGSYEAGRIRAESLLNSGAALTRLRSIIDLQGKAAPINWNSAHRVPVISAASGIVQSVNGLTISGIARHAGAPTDKLAGVYLHSAVGQKVQTGDMLYEIYGCNRQSIEAAVATAKKDSGFQLA